MYRTHRPIVILFALVCVGALFAGAILMSTVTRRHVRLDDGTVWILSASGGKAARLNVRLRQADAMVPLSSATADITQHGSHTVLRDGARILGVNAATLATDPAESVGEQSEVQTAGGVLAVLDSKTGDVRVGHADDMGTLDSAAAPRMALGQGGLVCVSHDGTIHGLRPSDGAVLTLDGASDHSPSITARLTGLRGRAPDGFTVIGDRPVAIVGSTVFWPGGQTTLDGAGPFTVQRAPVDDAQRTWAAFAGRGTLDLVDLTASQTTAVRLTGGGNGQPAVPVSSGGCVFAAWSQRQDNHLRVCAPKASGTVFDTLENIDQSSRLTFRTNHRLVVLNDVADGDAWDMDDPDETIRVQWRQSGDEHTDERASDEMTTRTTNHYRSECSPQSGVISAEKDAATVRAGERRVLHVLRNDRQTDCSVLRVVSISQPGQDVRVAVTADGRALQLDASDASPGEVRFSYVIDDGRGQESSAEVSLMVAPQDGNGPPQQVDAPPSFNVEREGRLSVDVLDGFEDPDGDTLALVDARVTDMEGVTTAFRPDGLVIFDATRALEGEAQVSLTVRDSSGDEASGTATLRVHAAGTLAPSMNPMSRSLVVGVPTLIDLEPYVQSSSSTSARLESIDETNGATVTRHGDSMSFSVEVSSPGTHYLPVTLSQGSLTSSGLVRLDAHAATSSKALPIAVDDATWLDEEGTAVISPLDNDLDPMGGVLTLTSVQVDPQLGVKAGIIDGARIVLSSASAIRESVSLSYEATNVSGTDRGVVTVHPAPISSSSPMLAAPDMTLRVRAGGIVSAHVLEALESTTRDAVRLLPELQFTDEASATHDSTIPVRSDSADAEVRDRGLAFVSEGTIRYQAPERAGMVPVRYALEDDVSNVAWGTVTFAVHERNAANKPAPSPRAVEARALAGRTVRIPIPLEGIDVDGDDIQLLGLGNRAPRLGRIVEVQADSLIYEAFPDSQGTDVFSYAVEDWTGRRAQARISVGITAHSQANGVVARDDAVTVRPGVEVTVPVTDNDLTDGEGKPRVLKDVEADGLDAAAVSVEDDSITFTAPDDAGTVSIAYTIADEAGFRDSATLMATIDPAARIEAPSASDHRVPAASTIDATSVDVDVSAWIANPSGPTDDLHVDVHPSASAHARRKGDNLSTTITIELTDRARAVPYTVTNTAHDLVSTAFLYVPAFGVFPPLLRTGAPRLEVRAGDSIDIPLADHVRVGAGKTPIVADTTTISATKAKDVRLADDGTTLRYTAHEDASGPASVTFEAADGRRSVAQTDAHDTDSDNGTNDIIRLVNTAMLTLPITVIGKGASTPIFTPGSVEVAAGEEAVTLNLRALTRTPSGGHDPSNAYRYSGGLASGPVTATVSPTGQMTVRAAGSAQPGTTALAPVSIDYGTGILEAGITVRVTATNRPLPRLNARAVRMAAGETQRVHMFADAYNPFPGTPLELMSATVEAGAGLSVSTQADGVVLLSVAEGSGAFQGTVRVTARDATGLASREASATITVSVASAPDAPLLSSASRQAGEGMVALSWVPGEANGSPILEYQVSWHGASDGSRTCGTAVSCTVPGLVNGGRYTFTVRARNAIGWSAPSNALEAMPDRAPEAPTSVTVTGGVRRATVQWLAPRYVGTPPNAYIITLRGPNGWSDTRTVHDALSVAFDDIPDVILERGNMFTATVRARNVVGDGPDSAPSAPAEIQREQHGTNPPTGTDDTDQPTSPDKPERPTQPDDSGGATPPTEPEKPEQPDDKNPTEPEEPDPPIEPENPNPPTEPEEPNPPVDPDPPVEPEEPEPPTEPEEPDPPTEPEEPDPPTEPEKPDPPMEPEEPEPPTGPENPDSTR